MLVFLHLDPDSDFIKDRNHDVLSMRWVGRHRHGVIIRVELYFLLEGYESLDS